MTVAKSCWSGAPEWHLLMVVLPTHSSEVIIPPKGRIQTIGVALTLILGESTCQAAGAIHYMYTLYEYKSIHDCRDCSV